jgi:hypothetical protein
MPSNSPAARASGVTAGQPPEDARTSTNVIVGVDGRNGGRDAMRLAHQLADRSARVTLVHVYGEPKGLPAAARP